MIASTSPLQAIQHKESELRRRVEEAQRQAAARIQAAQEEAKKIITQAHLDGQAEAQAIFQRGLEETRQQAEALVATAHQEASTLRHRAMTRLDEVAQQIVELVLPAKF